MAAVPRIIVPVTYVAVCNVCAEFRGGDEAPDGAFIRRPLWAGALRAGVDEAEHWRSLVELVVPAVEARAGEEGEPEFAGEREAHEAGGLVRREAEKDLLNDLFRQRQCRRPRQRRHGLFFSVGFRLAWIAAAAISRFRFNHRVSFYTGLL